MQVKHLNKSRLQILEIKVLQNAYLVDGCLNLIIRFTTLKPISSTVHNTTLALACYSSSQQLVHSCTEFVQEAKIPHSDQHFGSGDYRLLNTSNNTNTRRRNSSASVSSELTHRSMISNEIFQIRNIQFISSQRKHFYQMNPKRKNIAMPTLTLNAVFLFARLKICSPWRQERLVIRTDGLQVCHKIIEQRNKQVYFLHSFGLVMQQGYLVKNYKRVVSHRVWKKRL
jgi:hypothetical protein